MSCLTILGIEIQAVEVDAQRQQHTQANLDGLRWSEAYFRLPLYGIEKEVQHCWALAAMRVVWVAGRLNSGALHYEVGCRTVDEICAAGSSPHWTAVFCNWVAYSQGWCVEGACAGTPEVPASFTISFAELRDIAMRKNHKMTRIWLSAQDSDASNFPRQYQI